MDINQLVIFPCVLGLQKTSALLKTQKPSIKNKNIDLGVKSKYVASQQQTVLVYYSEHTQ